MKQLTINMLIVNLILLIALPLLAQQSTVNDKQIPTRSAFHFTEIQTLTTSTLQVIRFRPDPPNRRSVQYTDMITTSTLTGTGRFQWQLKPGYFIDERTGKAYREMTDTEKQIRFRGGRP